MSKSLLSSIFITVWILNVNCNYEDRAKIWTSNGNLYIEPGRDKNIYLRINGPQSYLFFGDRNLINVTEGRASQIYNSIIDNVDALALDLNNIRRRLDALEKNKFMSPSDFMFMSNVTVLSIRINRLTHRLNGLQRQIDGWSEEHCQIHTCQNGGTCLNLAGDFHCLCPSNWEGRNCEIDVNECRNFASTDLGCQNGADCINKPGTYECQCKTGWFGTHCTKRKMDCSEGSFEMCGHGTCVPVNSGEGIKCICDQGWTTNGSVACLTDVNECNAVSGPRCSINPKVECINLPGSFRCGQCPHGFQGDGYICYDIDECETSNGGCSSMVSCHNTIGSRICGACPPGYIGDGITCTWRGSCNIDHGGCHPSARCIENSGFGGGSQCECPQGMDGDGVGLHGCYVSSENGTSCKSNPCGPNGRCHMLQAGYTCFCLQGFTGAHCDIKAQSCVTNPCKNGGVCKPYGNAKGFICECTAQYTGTLCQERSYCGSILRAEEGNLMYPLSDTHNGPNSKCAWIIRTVPEKVINVTFSRFNLERSPDCNFNFLQIHDGRNTAAPLIGRFCGDDPPKGGNIVSNQHNLYLWFLTNSENVHNGFSLHWNSVTPICGGEVNATLHGAISSPGSPGMYPPKRDCYWHLRTTLGKRIQLHFFQLDLEIHNNCSFDYIAIYDGGNPQTGQLLEKYCSTTQPTPIQSAGPEVVIHFHSDDHGSGKGFQIVYASIEGVPGCGGFFSGDIGEITSPSFDGSYLNNLMCEYKIRTGPETQIQLDFKTFHLERSVNCKRDYVKIYDGPTIESSIIGTFCGKLDRKITLKSTSNNVFVVFRTDQSSGGDGFKISYKVICNYLVRGDSGEIKSPGYPFTYPDNRICEYVIETMPGKAIQLTFQDFDVEGDTRCLFDNVEVRDGFNANSTLLGSYCGNKIPPIQTSTHNVMYIRFNSDMSQSASGFYANFTTINIECGGIHKENTGTISYPSGDEKYKNKQTCTWMIIAPSGMYINLIWNKFQLEVSAKCNADYLKIYMIDEDNKNASRKFCGQKKPPIMTVTTNSLLLKFVSDASIADLGFSVTYNFVDNKKQCGGNGNYVHNHGVIYSPGWPSRYGRNLDCVWVISAPKGQQIKLNISQFDLEDMSYRTEECDDYLRVTNGPSEDSPLIGKYCGEFKWKTITSSANTMHIHFHSDFMIGGKGFKIEWDTTVTGCGGKFTSKSGYISSPNYPESYNDNSECFYRIVTSHGSRISLNILFIQLEHLCDDYLEIFDGRDPESPSLGQFCKLPRDFKPLETTSNYAFIKFRSDFAMNGKGFLINYKTICNNKITGSYGVIESLNYPNYYPSNVNCTWNINVTKGSRINVTFTDFDIDSARHLFWRSEENLVSNPSQIPETCNRDYLLISEPEHINSSPRLCGSFTNIPTRISTKGNSLQIFFSTSNLRGLFKHTGFRLEWVSYGCRGHIRKSFGFLNKTLSTTDQIECGWLIETPLDTTVRITFTKVYMLKTDKCTTDAIEIYNGPDDRSPLITKFCNDDVTVQSTSNYLFVKLVKNSSLKDVYLTASFHTSLSTCGGFLKTHSGVISSKNYPKNYDNNLNCLWIITVPPGHRIVLQFMDIDLNGNNKKCSDSIKLYNTKNDISNRNYSAIICNKFSQKVYVSKSNTLQVQFVTNEMVTAKGFKANFSMTCGGVISDSENGIIDTNNFIDPSNHSCIWTILAPKLEQKVSLTITYLHIPIANDHRTNKTCPNSYLRVLDGNDENAPLIDEYCGRKVPATIVSRGSALTLELGTNDDRKIGKFSAYYSTVDSACGGTLTSESGAIASPNYPAPYPVNVVCEWTIKTSPGNRVSLSIDMIDIASSEECNEDYLEIREHNGAGAILGLYCGSVLPLNTTSGSELYVKFGSDDKSPGRGFLLHYNFIHGNDITDLDYGEIASPLYPNPYDGSGEFWWRITSGNKAINIEVDKLQIHAYSETCEDNLSIYDGHDEEAPLLRQLCGALHSKTVLLRTTSNAAYIKLTLNLANEEALFHLRCSQGYRDVEQITDKPNCGLNSTLVIMPGKSQTFSSPNYPLHYDVNQNCEWVFKATYGRHLSLYFSDFDIEEREPCTYGDRVSIFESNVPAEWKPAKENVCLQSDVQNIFNTSTFMKVIFHSDYTQTKKGFFAEVWSLCGAVLTGPSGVIEVIPLDFNGQSFKCDWKVEVKPGRRIQLEFINFYIKNEANDCKSYIVLHNGESESSPLLSDGKYCGYSHENRSTMITSGNHLFVSFFTKFRTFNQTFKLHYEEVLNNCGLISELDADHSWEIINSPNYPNVPDPYTECNWVFTGPIGERLRIDFIDRFDIHKSVECASEFVEIHDGSSAISPTRGRYCAKNPGTVKTTSNSVFIKYVTELSEPNNGFKANISIDICGGTIYLSQGEITSPGYPNSLHLPPGTVCEWHIIGSERHILSITPQHMNLPQSESLCGTKVTINEWNPVINAIDILKTYCTDNFHDLSTLQTAANNATIKFYIGTSNGFSYGDKHTGFRLTFKSSKLSCSEVLTTPDGYISTPRYPKNAYVEYCHWTIKVPDESRRITLEILDAGRGEIYISEGNYEQRISYIDMYNISSHNTTFKSSGNEMVIFLRNQHDGRFFFRARFSSYEKAVCGGSLSGITGQLKSPDVDTGYLCNWRYHADTQDTNLYKSMLITGTSNSSFTQTNSILFVPKVTIEYSRPTYGKQSESFSHGQFSYSIPVLDAEFRAKKSSSQYFNFDFQWKLQPCGGFVGVGETPINIINIPQFYNDSVDCTWALRTAEPYTTIEINIEALFQLDCTDEKIKIGRLSFKKRNYIFDYCKDNVPESPNIVSFSNVFVEYHSKAQSWNNVKVFVRTKSKCGGSLTNSMKFSSPNFPKGYSSNLECEWVIATPEFGFRVSIEFINRFAIEKSINCTKDSVIIYDWKDENYFEIARLCGRELPPVFNSTYNKLKVVLRTDNDTNLDGFEAKWYTICGGTYNATTTEQYLYSPGYPYYWPLKTCTYRLVAPNEKLEIKFLEFDVEGSIGDCGNDNLTISSKDYTRYYFEIFCGNEIPKINTLLTDVEIVFNSDNSVQKRGFKLAYSLYSCGGNITEPTRISPSSSETYNNNVNCTWFIEAPKDKKVVLEVIYFQLEVSYECMNDYLAIYDGLNVDSEKRLALICGDVKPSTVIQSKGNTLTAEFISDAYTQLKGFNIDVRFTYSESVGCGGDINITSSSYTLTSPHINSQVSYENFLDCHWNIRAPADHIIKISFTSFHIAPCRNVNQTALGYSQCDCDFVQIKDGINPLSLEIGTYCGHTLPPEVITSKNILSIRLSTDGEITSSGFTANLIVQESDCGPSTFNVTDKALRVTSPGYITGTIPRGIHCAYNFIVDSYEHSHIHFNDFDLQPGTSSGLCDKDKIFISSVYISSDASFGKKYLQGNVGQSSLSSLVTFFGWFYNYTTPQQYMLCGSKKSIDLYVTGPFLMNIVTSPDAVNQYKGIDVEVTKLSFCGRNFTELYGRIMNFYTYNITVKDCYTLISAPENYTISVYFNTYVNTIAAWDSYLEMYDGNTTTARKILTSANAHPDMNPVFSTGRYILIRNHLTSLDQLITYDFTFISTDKGRGCGGYFYGAEGTVTSPLYPGIYRQKTTCEWKLETPHGTKVALHFEMFDLGNDCDNNYLQLVDRSGNVLSNYCSETPADFTSADNFVKIVFVTNRNNGGLGWLVRFLSVL